MLIDSLTLLDQSIADVHDPPTVSRYLRGMRDKDGWWSSSRPTIPVPSVI